MKRTAEQLKEFLQRAVGKIADLRWADLSRVDLSRADLSEANLSWATGTGTTEWGQRPTPPNDDDDE